MARMRGWPSVLIGLLVLGGVASLRISAAPRIVDHGSARPAPETGPTEQEPARDEGCFA